MRYLLPALALLLGAAPSPPQRIVSLNLCADQYLLALADSGQIAALTRNAGDPALSAAAAKGARFRSVRGSVEDVLALRPDLVLAAPGWGNGAAGLLKERFTTIDLPPADSYADIAAQVRLVARAVGHPERGEALIRHMDERLARLPRDAGRRRVAAHYQRQGFLTGTRTLVDDLMGRVGLTNLAARLGKPMLARVSVEEMALARPDYLVIEAEAREVSDRGTELLHHPLLSGIPRLSLPRAWTICGGPAYVLAAESLVAQLRRTERPR